MVTVDAVLLIGAALCFGFEVARVPTPVNLQALGLLLWVLAILIP